MELVTWYFLESEERLYDSCTQQLLMVSIIICFLKNNSEMPQDYNTKTDSKFVYNMYRL